MIYLSRILFIGLLLVGTVFAAPSIYTDQTRSIMVTAKNPVFVIQLKSNPTTGYAWFLKGYDPSILIPTKHEFKPSSDKKMMGAPGFEIWTFKAKPNAFIVPQQTTIQFAYTRPWEIQEQEQQVIFRVSTRNSR